jgi:hypothetical protein
MATASPGFFFQVQQGGLGHGFGQLRDLDFNDCHDVSLELNGWDGPFAPPAAPLGVAERRKGFLTWSG